MKRRFQKRKNHYTKNETADLVTFTGEILNGKLHFLCSEFYSYLTTEYITDADNKHVRRVGKDFGIRT